MPRYVWTVLCAGMAAAIVPRADAQLSTQASQEVYVGSMAGPHTFVRAERAIFRWRSAPGSKLRVDFGPTPNLGTRVDGSGTSTSSAVTLYEASLESLKIGTPYYYRATLYRESNGIVKPVSESGLLTFRTPHVRVRVQPVRLDVKRDGDKDYFGNKNKGEAEFSWRVAVDPDTPVWPSGTPLLGCYPGGGTVTVTGPAGPDVEMPGGTYSQNPPPTQGLVSVIAGTIVNKLGEPTPPTYQTPRCVPDESAPFMVSSPKRAKVSSGSSIELKEVPIEWILPDGYPLTPASAVASQVSAGAGRAGKPASKARPPTAAGKTSDVEQNDPKQGVNENAGGTGTPPGPASACEAAATRHAFVALHARVKGTERDKINNPTTGGQDVTYTQKASGRETLCLDLRARDGSTMLGVRARGERFEFKVWFKVDLIYDRN